jgi:hypothetical protein
MALLYWGIPPHSLAEETRWIELRGFARSPQSLH